MARRAGVDAAPSKPVVCGTRKVLLVERFDIHSATMGRHHMISMQTLLRAEGYKQQSKADKIISAIFSVVSNLENFFKEFDVPYRDIEIIGKDIEGRMAKIKC